MSARTSLLSGSVARVCVYRLPEHLTDGYCFGEGRPIEFTNVDWFDVVIQAVTRQQLTDFVSKKRYFEPRARFLVLGDHPDFTFVIEPERPS